MADLEWQDAIDLLTPFVVKISTPRGSGTGFLAAMNDSLYGIATAAHVINQAHYWEEPIRISHPNTGKSALFRANERGVFVNERLDTATVLVNRNTLPLPGQEPHLSPEGKFLRVGGEMGWVGFPAVAPNNLCFFHGRASCWLVDESAYLIDGVAINGVSGGPAFTTPVTKNDQVRIVGVVSAYLPNRVTGEPLPGLSIIRDVTEIHELVKTFQSLEEARRKEEVPRQPDEGSSEPSPDK